MTLPPCSEPTVWDGDRAHLSGKARKYSVSFLKVPSPPCGMVTRIMDNLLRLIPFRSKPTLWDGDAFSISL